MGIQNIYLMGASIKSIWHSHDVKSLVFRFILFRHEVQYIEFEVVL
jgi:hypothetical protein